MAGISTWQEAEAFLLDRKADGLAELVFQIDRNIEQFLDRPEPRGLLNSCREVMSVEMDNLRREAEKKRSAAESVLPAE